MKRSITRVLNCKITFQLFLNREKKGICLENSLRISYKG